MHYQSFKSNEKKCRKYSIRKLVNRFLKLWTRRLLTVFWATCVFGFICIFYVVTNIVFKARVRPAAQDNAVRWSSFETKINQMETELNRQRDDVGEIKNALDRIERNKKKRAQTHESEKRIVEDENAVIRETPKQVLKDPVQRVEYKIPKMSQCPISKEVLPKIDIQMLSMYERVAFHSKPPHPYRAWNMEYSEQQWSRTNKLKVFIVPHSHNDPGWLKTFENYYETKTKAIFNNMVKKLNEVPGRKFIWCETSFLALWWTQDATDKDKAAFVKLLKSGNIEIVTGGWVMNDEANSHWLSIIEQLTAGHQWLLDHLEYIPKNHWSIDPFGYSGSQPYLLKLAGLQNSVIQRVHYRIKKELSMSRQLEFKWRQLWDGVGETDMFTHVMPFYFYDILHSCGPNPKICCQFDFKRLPGSGMTCPLGALPQNITQNNVLERASLILDQWRKKAQLYRSNVVLVPLGDDFRYDAATEWDNQYRNYEALIDYINNRDDWNTEVQFGTLEDYFKAVHAEIHWGDIPVLSGDFFTYADRKKHYWSGYYTSRPFYKHMDRVLLAYVRAAEIISAQAVSAGVVSQVLALQLRDRCEHARRTLALFQHHDGVTGTARDDVREDYAKKILEAIRQSQSAIQQAAYYLVGQPKVQEQTQEDVYFHIDEIWRRHDEIPQRITIALDVVSPARRLVLYNALNFARTDILTVLVNTPHVEVFDPSGSPLMAQISPVVVGEKRLAFAPNKYQLSFPAAVPALGLATYTVALRDSSSLNKYTSYARVRIYNADYWSVELPKMFVVEQTGARLEDDVALAANGSRLVCNKLGLLKEFTSPHLATSTFPLAMDFVQYKTLKKPYRNSGAYLFFPKGPGESVSHDDYPEMVVSEGIYKATIYTRLNTPRALEMILAMSVYNNPTLPQAEVWVTSTFLLDPAVDDLEVGLRLSTRVRNGDAFYTDLNGMQMIKRRYFEKLPLQANFYPLPAAAYIQDETHRLTLLTSTPLGMAALQPGQMQVMLDRRLSRDDNCGLTQGVMDNVRTAHTFRLIVETARKPCPHAVHPSHPSGQLSLGAHVAAQTLLQPLVSMHYTAARDHSPPPPAARAAPAHADLLLAAFHAHVTTQTAEGKTMQGIGLTFQRVYLDPCFGNKDISKWYPVGDGQVDVSWYVPASGARVFPSTLTFTRAGGRLNSTRLALCPMEVRSVFLDHTPSNHLRRGRDRSNTLQPT